MDFDIPRFSIRESSVRLGSFSLTFVLFVPFVVSLSRNVSFVHHEEHEGEDLSRRARRRGGEKVTKIQSDAESPDCVSKANVIGPRRRIPSIVLHGTGTWGGPSF